LSERGTTFKQYHYELLIEAHVGADDLHTTLTILCIMNAVQMKPDLESLIALRRCITDDPSGPERYSSSMKGTW